MALFNEGVENPKVVLHNGDTITLQELAGLIFNVVGGGDPLFQFKGDMIVAQFAGLAGRLPVGVNGQSLIVDNTEALGVKWTVPALGGGDVLGPASSVDDHIVLFNLTSGKSIKSSVKTIADVFADHVALADPHSQYALDTDLNNYQPLDALLTSLAALAFSSNTLKVLRVNAAETAFELVTLAGGGDMLAANNLSDLINAAAARTNLGLGALAVLAQVGAAEIGSDAVTTIKILNSNVTFAKLQDIATARFLGRVTASTGIIEELTAAQAKTLLALVKADVGLGNVDNTSDANKPLSTADIAEHATKQDSDAQLDDIAALSYAGNSLKVLRVNVGETAIELVTIGGGGDLLSTNNLSDLANAAASRSNLGLAALAILAAVTEAEITLTDNTTNDVSITKHGLAPKAPNVATQYLNGVGAYSTPPDTDNDTLVNETITLSGDATGSGTNAITVVIGANVISTAKILDAAVTLAKLANIATARFLGRVTAATGVVEELTAAQAKTILALVKGDVGLGNVDNTADVNKTVANSVEWDGAALSSGTGAPSGGADGDIYLKYT